MKTLLHLLRFDMLLMARNKVFVVSAAVTFIYILLFRWLSGFMPAEKVLVLVIFHDPALLGFLFAGVLMLMESNENTLIALKVSPISLTQYIFSKTIWLSIISLICSLSMVIATKGMDFLILHFCLSVLLSTSLFAFAGFYLAGGVSNFNTYMLRALGGILILSLPFLGYFEIGKMEWYFLIPTSSCIVILDHSLNMNHSITELIFHYSLLSLWMIAAFRLTRIGLQKISLA